MKDELRHKLNEEPLFAAEFVRGSWTVLAPWVLSEHGFTYRPHVEAFGIGREAQESAEYLASALNRAIERKGGQHEKP